MHLVVQYVGSNYQYHWRLRDCAASAINSVNYAVRPVQVYVEKHTEGRKERMIDVDDLATNIQYASAKDVIRPHDLRSEKLTIAVDCDEVLALFVPSLVSYHNETFGTSLTPQDFHSYRFCDVWGGTNEEATEKMYDFFESRHFLDGIKSVRGALNVLRTYKAAFDFVIVTSRQSHIRVQTHTWLREHFPGVFSDVMFGNHYTRDAPDPDIAAPGKRSKPEMCDAANAFMLIDDSVKYARQCSKNLKKVVLFGDYAWNRVSKDDQGLPSNVIRAKDWSGVARVLQREVEAKWA